MITNSFRSDCEFVFEKLKRRESFAFSKFADGEFLILVNQGLTNIDGWTFNPTSDQKSRELLFESFQYDHSDYIVGISCPCCQPASHVNWMRNTINAKLVTWANLFVNANHDFFVNNYIPEFAKWKVNLVATEKGKIENLPFELETFTPIGNQAWKDQLDLIPVLEDLAREKEGELFLFCAGPFGNMLAYKLHKANPKNTYIDIGSTLNGFLLENPNRDYLTNTSNISFKNRICTW
jgi:hypothetical protein